MKPALIKTIAVTAILLVAVLATVGYNYSTQAKNTPQTTVKASQVTTTNPTPPTRAELLKLVNQERAKYGVAPLKEVAILDNSAQWKADDEVKYDYFGHVRPGTTGNDGLDYLNSLHPPCTNISENLTWTTDGSLETAQWAIKWWIGSTAHREAMLNPKYTLTGFGIVHDAVVEHFCQP